MAEFNLWPSLTFLFAATNLASWYFRGYPLFSWWWIVAVIGIEIVIQSIMLAAMKTALKLNDR